MDRKEVSILIPSRFNNRWVLDLNLRTIRKYTSDYPYRIIIGDAGIEPETLDFLSSQKDVRVVKCPDPIRPKNHLARIGETPYFLFLHDDVQILKKGWLSERVRLLEKDNRNGIVGETTNNYIGGWKYKKYFTISPLYRRFFPLGMLVRKECQDEINLFWGKILQGFDSGGIAFLQFRKQRKWKFINYKFKTDIKHWAQMTWVMEERKKTTLDVAALQNERNDKIKAIKRIIEEGAY